jgi:hypothetical protein
MKNIKLNDREFEVLESLVLRGIVSIQKDAEYRLARKLDTKNWITALWDEAIDLQSKIWKSR